MSARPARRPTVFSLSLTFTNNCSVGPGTSGVPCVGVCTSGTHYTHTIGVLEKKSRLFGRRWPPPPPPPSPPRLKAAGLRPVLCKN